MASAVHPIQGKSHIRNLQKVARRPRIRDCYALSVLFNFRCLPLIILLIAQYQFTNHLKAISAWRYRPSHTYDRGRYPPHVCVLQASSIFEEVFEELFLQFQLTIDSSEHHACLLHCLKSFLIQRSPYYKDLVFVKDTQFIIVR